MKRLLMLGLMLAVLLFPQVSALNWEKSCINETHLFKEIIYGSSGATNELNQTIYCPFGCEEGLGKYGADCVEPNYIIILYVILGIVALFVFLVWAGRK